MTSQIWRLICLRFLRLETEIHERLQEKSAPKNVGALIFRSIQILRSLLYRFDGLHFGHARLQDAFYAHL
jgi:hypothetical protein